MNKRITFRHMEHLKVVEDFANKKLEKIEHLIKTERTPLKIDLVLEAAPTHAHNRVELIVATADYHLVAHHEGPDIYREIDNVIAKMLTQIRNAKEKRDDQHKKAQKISKL